ncbi:DUF4238 domain-containing protein (plasmid) [Cupriavidus necator]
MTTNPPKGNDARNHHYVPQCYLKGFARNRSKNAQLFVVDTKTKRAFVTTPRNLAAQRDFNRVEIPGHDPNIVEAGYADLEAQLAPALVRIDQHGDFYSEEDKALVLELIALLATRNPGFREARRQALEKIYKIVGGMVVSTQERYESQFGQARAAGYLKGEPLPYEEMREFIESERYTVEVPSTSPTSHVATELKLLAHMRDLIHRRGWTLLRAPSHCGGFVTSDHPVVLEWDDPERMNSKIYSPGFGLRSTTIFFPVTKHFALHGHFDQQDGRTIQINEQGVAAINFKVFLHAHRQIYAESERFGFIGVNGEIQRGSALLDLIAGR